MVRTVAAISLGAIAGALSRYYLGLYLGQMLGTQLPYGTLIINVTGCFVMGVMTAVSLGQVVILAASKKWTFRSAIASAI